jgi:hypothetical protein
VGRSTRIEFKADIVLKDEEIDAAGGLEQAVQNEIGPSGARLIRVTTIAEGPAGGGAMSDRSRPDGQPADRRFTTFGEFVGVARYEWRMRRAWTTRLALLRGLWWTFARRYAHEICTCGRPVGQGIGSYWRAPDVLWNEVAGWDGWEKDLGEYSYLGPPGTFCPRCFTERAETKGIHLHWVPER